MRTWSRSASAPELAGRADETTDQFPRLREWTRQLAGVLSGGEWQTLVVSRTPMSHPKALLLDEMNPGLTPVIVREVLGHMTGLAAGGTAVVVAEPSIVVMRDHIDRGYVLVRGRITTSAGTTAGNWNGCTSRRSGQGLDGFVARSAGTHEGEREVR